MSLRGTSPANRRAQALARAKRHASPAIDYSVRLARIRAAASDLEPVSPPLSREPQRVARGPAIDWSLCDTLADYS